MNDRISALVDGELSRDEALATIKSLGASEAARAEWDCYHVIGSTLRGESAESFASRRARTDALFARLSNEPTVLVPAAMKKPAATEKRTRIALAMAASVVTMSAVGIVAWKQQSVSVAPAQLVAQPAPVAVLPDTRVNDYLAVHRQFANSAGFQAAALNKPEAAKKAAAR